MSFLIDDKKRMENIQNIFKPKERKQCIPITKKQFDLFYAVQESGKFSDMDTLEARNATAKNINYGLTHNQHQYIIENYEDVINFFYPKRE